MADTMLIPTSARPLNIALIDNYDSYTHNLAHLLASANRNVLPTIILADTYLSLNQLLSAYPSPFDAFVISPGPGNPTNTLDFSPLQRDILSSDFPVFGVCLGHQGLCHAYGATIHQLPSIPAHGIISQITLAPAARNDPIFASVPTTFSAVRYHSLIAVPPKHDFKLIPTAYTINQPRSHLSQTTSQTVLMAVSHPLRPHFGVQFHPESVASQHGHIMMKNFVNLATRLKISLAPSPELPPHPTYLKQLDAPILYTTHVKVLPIDPVVMSSQLLFQKLFAHHPAPFWLDSSTAEASSRTPPKDSTDPEGQLHYNGQAQQKSRYSIMGACNGPLSELVTFDVNKHVVHVTTSKNIQNGSSRSTEYQASIFAYLREQLHLRKATVPPELPCQMNGGYVGYLGYELKSSLPGVTKNYHKSSLPDAWLVFADRLLIVDHLQKQIFLVALTQKSIKAQAQDIAAFQWFSQMMDQLTCILQRPPSSEKMGRALPSHASGYTKFSSPLAFVPQRRHDEYLADIDKCMQAIKEGDTYEICLTNRLETRLADDCEVNHLDFYCSLRELNRAPYSAFLQISESDAVCCTSPEKFLSIDCDGRVESKPIKGTRPRGSSLEADKELQLDLQNSVKDRSENLMIVDLVRNDLSRTCRAGSVVVPKLMRVESYTTVHQLVSTITGKLSHEHDVIDCVEAAFPMGSMTGAPKIRTMEIIDSLEHSARGVYSGTIGYFAVGGAVDLNVVIRTAVVQGAHVSIGVGGAIVALSDPQEEYDEIILKGSALMQAVALSTRGQRDAFHIAHEF